MNNLPLQLVEPDDEAYAAFSAYFDSHNAQHSSWNPRSFSIIVENDDIIIAGVRGILNMGAVEVRGLWVNAASRSTGLGRRIMRRLENEAVKRGAKRAQLYTFSWQAETFYIKMGYQPYARFEYPDGYARIDMQKELV